MSTTPATISVPLQIDNFISAIRQGINVPINVALALQQIEFALQNIKGSVIIAPPAPPTPQSGVTFNGSAVLY